MPKTPAKKVAKPKTKAAPAKKPAPAKPKAAKQQVEQAAPVGRPSSFTQATANRICMQIADGKSLRTICKDDAMPDKATVMRWLADEKHAAFRDQYACAREEQADKLAEEIIEIADDGRNDTYIDPESG
ncbi:MAG TPA: hypothetical protein VIT92_00635, partial [Burkholderiaceae bacterium]